MKKQHLERANIISFTFLSIFFLLFFNKNIFLFYLFGILVCSVNIILWQIIIEQMLNKKLKIFQLIIFLNLKLFIIGSIIFLINFYGSAFIIPASISFISSLFTIVGVLIYYSTRYTY